MKHLLTHTLACSMLLLLLAGACDGTEGGGDGDTSNSPDTSVIDNDTSSGPVTFESVAAEFGILETIAGLGTEREKSVNGWDPSMEGGPATQAELSRPHMALSDDAGNVYIADKDSHAILRIDPNGFIHTVAGTHQPGFDGDLPAPGASHRLQIPNGIWVLADGTVYILDLGNDKVRKLTPGGELSTLFDIGGAGAGRGLWVADDESLAYVSAGAQLKAWTPSGGIRVLASGFVSLGNLAVEADGNLLVTDRLAHSVYRVSPDSGERTLIAGNGTDSGGGDGQPALDTGLDEVRGVWPHPRGGYFLATHKGGQVWYVDVGGIIHLFVDGDTDHTHEGDGQHFQTRGRKISEPRAVTLDRAGNMLITENDFGYIRRINRAAP